MRNRLFAVAAFAVAGVLGVSGCSGQSPSTDSKEITYWASQQSPSIEIDKKILQPELAKFTKETGIKVNLEVIPFADLLNRILTATTSGKGPDVLNIGNTWSASLQATGAFLEWDDALLDEVGGKDRFAESAMQSTGAPDEAPVGLPLYSKVFELYYNKHLFSAAGITEPPTTWDEFVDDAKKMTKDTDGDGKNDQWGLGVRGQQFTTASQYAFILGSQHGAEAFDGTTPTFDDPGMVEGIDQYLSWMGKDGIVNPSDAENANWSSVYENFANNKAGMMIVQTLGKTLTDYKLTDADYGVAAVPSAQDSAGTDVASILGGTNISILKNTKSQESSVSFVKFMTSDDEQVVLNTAFGTIPPVTGITDAEFDRPEAVIARDTIENRAVPMPQVPQESQFETLIGKIVTDGLAATATGKQPSTSQLEELLAAANKQLAAGS